MPVGSVLFNEIIYPVVLLAIALRRRQPLTGRGRRHLADALDADGSEVGVLVQSVANSHGQVSKLARRAFYRATVLLFQLECATFTGSDRTDHSVVFVLCLKKVVTLTRVFNLEIRGFFLILTASVSEPSASRARLQVGRKHGNAAREYSSRVVHFRSTARFSTERSYVFS